MKYFLKQLGFIFLFVGALLLIAPFFAHFQTNTTLLAGWLFIVLGFITYVLFQKRF